MARTIECATGYFYGVQDALDGEPCAVLDFRARSGRCRTNFPPPTAWTREPWEESAG